MKSAHLEVNFVGGTCEIKLRNFIRIFEQLYVRRLSAIRRIYIYILYAGSYSQIQ